MFCRAKSCQSEIILLSTVLQCLKRKRNAYTHNLTYVEHGGKIFARPIMDVILKNTSESSLLPMSIKELYPRAKLSRKYG